MSHCRKSEVVPSKPGRVGATRWRRAFDGIGAQPASQGACLPGRAPMCLILLLHFRRVVKQVARKNLSPLAHVRKNDDLHLKQLRNNCRYCATGAIFKRSAASRRSFPTAPRRRRIRFASVRNQYALMAPGRKSCALCSMQVVVFPNILVERPQVLRGLPTGAAQMKLAKIARYGALRPGTSLATQRPRCDGSPCQH